MQFIFRWMYFKCIFNTFISLQSSSLSLLAHCGISWHVTTTCRSVEQSVYRVVRMCVLGECMRQTRRGTIKDCLVPRPCTTPKDYMKEADSVEQEMLRILLDCCERRVGEADGKCSSLIIQYFVFQKLPSFMVNELENTSPLPKQFQLIAICLCA